MNKLNVRNLKESDWDTLCKWWEAWPKWVNPPKSFLPDNGTGGLMVYKEEQPICAGFLYFTNSDAVLLEWIVSDPEYREKDRKEALELLITTAEETCKDIGIVHMFSIGRNKHLINTHKKLGWTVDESASHELIKNI
jgi:hypothetical protein